MITPYNHCDPLEKQIPLPIKLRDLSDQVLVPSNLLHLRVSIPTASADRIIIELNTDSLHLAEFFSKNWLQDTTISEPSAKILALKEDAQFYGFSDDFNHSRWYCPSSKQVWMFGTEFYGNLKITVRGLCSELAPFEEMFLHGCSLSIDGYGLVLSGISGAGKTTITAALRSTLGSSVKIINDDWGSFSLNNGTLRSTEEPYLHMKYPSVNRLAPALPINPTLYFSENFSGEVENPRARLLIQPSEVFGVQNIQRETSLKLFVMVVRNTTEPVSYRRFYPQEMSILEGGQYSGFYKRTEWFLNGSLFLVDEIRRERTRKQHHTLLTHFPCIIINNSGDANECANLIHTVLQTIITENNRLEYDQ
jgi:hypothetical protein